MSRQSSAGEETDQDGDKQITTYVKCAICARRIRHIEKSPVCTGCGKHLCSFHAEDLQRAHCNGHCTMCRSIAPLMPIEPPSIMKRVITFVLSIIAVLLYGLWHFMMHQNTQTHIMKIATAILNATSTINSCNIEDESYGVLADKFL